LIRQEFSEKRSKTRMAALPGAEFETASRSPLR
jgi:hypothetical protein